MNENMKDDEKKMRALEARLAELKSMLPSKKAHAPGAFTHSDPIEMIARIEELEDELAEIKKRRTAPNEP